MEYNQEVLVLREELGPLSEGQRSRPTTPGWVFAVSDQNSGYVPRTYLEAEEDLAQSMTVRYVSKAERNTAAYNEAAVGQTTQGDYWVQKMAAELGGDAPDVPARPPPPSRSAGQNLSRAGRAWFAPRLGGGAAAAHSHGCVVAGGSVSGARWASYELQFSAALCSSPLACRY